MDQEEANAQRIRQQRDAIDHMRKENVLFRSALLAIAEWKMPYPGFGFDQGSNGERDHFRDLARSVLER